jgi:hypothetical protein
MGIEPSKQKKYEESNSSSGKLTKTPSANPPKTDKSQTNGTPHTQNATQNTNPQTAAPSKDGKAPTTTANPADDKSKPRPESQMAKSEVDSTLDAIPFDLSPEDIEIGEFLGEGVYSEVYKGFYEKHKINDLI